MSVVSLLKRIHKVVTDAGILLRCERVPTDFNPSDEPSLGFFPQKNKTLNLMKAYTSLGSATKARLILTARPPWMDKEGEPDFDTLFTVLAENFLQPATPKPKKSEKYGTVPDGTYW